MQTSTAGSDSKVIIALLLGVVGVASGSILIKWLENVPSLVIAAWRLVFASAIVIPWSRVQSAPSGTVPLKTCVWSGAFLAAHFACWITSLKYTSVASSVVLVSLSPILVSLYRRFVVRERIGPWVWAATALALVGTTIVGWGDLSDGGDVLLGDLLAFAGAIMVAGYWITGSQARQRLTTIQYASRTYSVAAVILIVAAIIGGGGLFDPGLQEFGLLFALALLPQLLGHASLSYALKAAGPGLVALVTLSEPLGASVLAMLLLGESLGIQMLIGGFLILLGILLGGLSESSRRS